MKFGAIRGRFRGGIGKNFNLDALKILAVYGSQTPETISIRIAKFQEYHYKTIMASLCDKDRVISGLHYLRQNEYIRYIELKHPYEESEMEITLKGLYIIFYFLDKKLNGQQKIHFNINIDFNLLKPHNIKFIIVENINIRNELYDFLKRLIPIKPIMFIWMDQIETKYGDGNFDDLSLELVTREFYLSAQKILIALTEVLVNMHIITTFYLGSEIDVLKKRILNWIDEKESNNNISKKLLNDRLSSEDGLSNFEVRLISLAHEILDYRATLPQDQFTLGAFRGRKNSPNYNLLIVKYLALNGSLTLTELSDKISTVEGLPIENVKSRLSHRESGRLKELHNKEYLIWPAFKAIYDRNPIYLTLKGFFAAISSSKLNDRYKYFKNMEINDYLSSVSLKSNNIPVGTLQDTDYFNSYLILLLPLKPIIIFWLEKIEKEHPIKELDAIKLEDIKLIFITMAERVLQIIVFLLVKDKVLEPYFMNDLETCLNNLIEWIDSHNPKEAISRGLLEDRLKSRKDLTKFEKRILDVYYEWLDSQNIM